MQRYFKKLLFAAIGVSCQVASSEDEFSTPPEPVGRIVHLVAQLGDEHYEVRERAHQQLIELGKDVLPALENLGEFDDLETRWRLRSVIKRLRRRPLVGTQWRIEATSKVNVKSKTIEFLADGKFRVVRGTQPTPEDETWDPVTEDGTIRFYFNNKYATYEGRRINNHTIVGESHNIQGETWTWRATLVKVPEN